MKQHELKLLLESIDEARAELKAAQENRETHSSESVVEKDCEVERAKENLFGLLSVLGANAGSYAAALGTEENYDQAA